MKEHLVPSPKKFKKYWCRCSIVSHHAFLWTIVKLGRCVLLVKKNSKTRYRSLASFGCFWIFYSMTQFLLLSNCQIQPNSDFWRHELPPPQWPLHLWQTEEPALAIAVAKHSQTLGCSGIIRTRCRCLWYYLTVKDTASPANGPSCLDLDSVSWLINGELPVLRATSVCSMLTECKGKSA